MMELLLVRHAIAFERDRLRWPDDGLRLLSPRGLLRMRRAAKGLCRLDIAPAHVLVSPLVRARHTAEILTSEARWPEATVISALAPAQPVRPLFKALAAHKVGRLAVVGHEPDLRYLLAYCVCDAAETVQIEFRKGGIACVGFGGAMRAGGGQLRWLLPPRVLRALAR